MKDVSLINTTGRTFYAFPDNQSLDDWTTYREILTEQSAPDLGRYEASLDETIDTLWRVFEGIGQPADWNESFESFTLIPQGSINIRYVYSPSTTLYAFPDGQTLDDWTTYRVQLVEQIPPNQGRYIATLDTIVSNIWRVFVGVSQPSDWVSAIHTFDLSASGGTPLDAGVCRVHVQSIAGIDPVQTRVVVHASTMGRRDEVAFMDIPFNALTDVDGIAFIDLPWSSLTGVGSYIFEFVDISSSKVLHRRECIVPNSPAADYAELTEVTDV